MTPPPPIPLEEAQKRLLDNVRPLAQERVSIEKAAGRWLAEDIMAQRTQPAADLSAMDGYVVRSDDLEGPWQVIGESRAGHPFEGALRQREAIRISTGALMPAGDGAVLLQEQAERWNDKLMLAAGGEPTTRHIRRRGFDFEAGGLLIRRGERLGPARLALAVSGGHAGLSVGRLASVAILDSGDELASDPSSCSDSQIPASNGPMLAAMATPFASAIDRIGPVADSMEALAAALERAQSCDVLITSGGASVGDHDLIRPALEAWGAEIDFWRVAMKPGKPLMIARRGEQWIVGLPGNPISSYVAAYLFVLPLLRALAGSPEPLPIARPARVQLELPPTGPRAEFVRSMLQGDEVTPVSEQDSSALVALAASNALIFRDRHAPALPAGTMAPVYRLENGGIA